MKLIKLTTMTVVFSVMHSNAASFVLDPSDSSWAPLITDVATTTGSDVTSSIFTLPGTSIVVTARAFGASVGLEKRFDGPGATEQQWGVGSFSIGTIADSEISTGETLRFDFSSPVTLVGFNADFWGSGANEGYVYSVNSGAPTASDATSQALNTASVTTISFSAESGSGATGFFSNIEVDTVNVPEPASSALIGLAGFAFLSRRKRS